MKFSNLLNSYQDGFPKPKHLYKQKREREGRERERQREGRKEKEKEGSYNMFESHVGGYYPPLTDNLHMSDDLSSHTIGT